MIDKDITDLVDFGLNDDECLPLTKCVCGQEFESWTFLISVYRDVHAASRCPNCKRRLYFRPQIRVFEIVADD